MEGVDHHTLKQQGGECSLACEFWVARRKEVCGYFQWAVNILLWPCQCIYSMRVHVSLTIALVGLQVSGLYVLWSCRCVWILARQSLVFIMQMSPSLSHGLMTMDWLFLRLFNAYFSCNIRLLQVFLRTVLTEMRPCSVLVKKLVKVGLSEGGSAELDFLLKWGVLS